MLLVLLLGLVLLLLPQSEAKVQEGDALDATGILLSAEGERLESLLSQIEGAGNTKVLISNKGAVVVCDGADSAQVRLNVTNAVSAYTGLGSDKISVIKMK